MFIPNIKLAANTLKIMEVPTDDVEMGGVFCLSIVDDPAIEVNGIYLSNKKEKVYLAKVYEDMLYAPFLIPDKWIYRCDDYGNEWYCMWPIEAVKESRVTYMKNHFGNFSFEHNGKKLDGITLIDSWIIRNPEMDQAKELGYTLPKGTWFGGLHIQNTEIQNLMKQGKYTGISIEGNFETAYEHLSTKLSKQDYIKMIAFNKDISDELKCEIMTKIDPDFMLKMIEDIK
jgi:hypothetical protein